MVSPAESKALAIAPKFTAFLSICGSLGIVVKVLCNENRRKATMHRIVMGMSMCDILASIWYFTGTWAIPAGTLSWFGDGESERIFWAAGDANGVSCSFAGFFNQFAVATPLYNSTLAVFYLLVVNYGWKDSQVGKIEWMLHAIPVGYALITSIFAVAADLYGHVEWTCWILPGEFFDETQELSPIQSKFQWIQWIFLFGAVWTCIIVVTGIFVVLFRKMKSIETTMRRYTYTSAVDSSQFSRDFSSRNYSSKGEFHSSLSMEMRQKSESPPQKEGRGSQTTECEHKSDMEEGDEEGSNNGDENSRNLNDDDAEMNVNTTSLQWDESGHADNRAVTIDEPKGAAELSNAEEGRHKEPESKRHSLSLLFKRKSLASRSGDAGNGGRSRRRKKEAEKSKKIAMQGLLYIAAFFITWLFPTISRFTELIAGRNYFPIQFLDTFLIPLQGFFNFMIYIRPRFLAYRSRHEDEGFWKSLTSVVTEIKIG